ncbi:kinesin-like protein KIN-14L [Juglans microcarpa x Juglans regia]|uniref:kinesin-like protein KIN-14L n=1 Tax=Juglans microcarpa x Juglans regia TaxID=2249226 RepID=UPI001B7F2EAA|nr:kinesin-like protein KIN-14L [Juglans microcarpa x Juglans regia]
MSSYQLAAELGWPARLINQPSERAFISLLRNGLVLCNAINKINPGSVPKVVENQSHLQSVTWESQPLPAYQYFEFECAKLFGGCGRASEASDLERDALEARSVSKVVDCILALKAYHEWKQMGSENGSYRSAKYPLGNFGHASTAISSDSSKRLDMSAACEKQTPV